MLSFGTSVAVNNLLALRAFYTFLFNFSLHEKPTFIERVAIKFLRKWVEVKALYIMKELLSDVGAATASISLNDVSGDFFAVLYCVQNPQLVVDITVGQELFIMLANMSLEFEKVKHPRDGTKYIPQI